MQTPVGREPRARAKRSEGQVERWATFDCYGTLVDWNAGIRAVVGDENLARYHELDALGASLPGWPAFPEVPGALEEARGRGWKLAILSNTDRDFIEASMRRLGGGFEVALGASGIAAYKT